MNFKFLASVDDLFEFVGIGDPEVKATTAMFLAVCGEYATSIVNPESSIKRLKKAHREIAKAFISLTKLFKEYDTRVAFLLFEQVVLFAKSDSIDPEPISSLEKFREIEEEKAILALTPGITLQLAFYAINQDDDDSDDDDLFEEEDDV